LKIKSVRVLKGKLYVETGKTSLKRAELWLRHNGVCQNLLVNEWAFEIKFGLDF